MNIIAWVLSNFNVISYGVIAVVVGGLAWTAYRTIEQNGQNKIIIEQLKQDKQKLITEMKFKDSVIQYQQTTNQIANEITKQRDDELERLRLQLEEYVTSDLGTDIDDQAPVSIKELIRKMGVQNAK